MISIIARLVTCVVTSDQLSTHRLHDLQNINLICAVRQNNRRRSKARTIENTLNERRTIEKTLYGRRLYWFSHLIQMDYKRLPQQALYWEVPDFKRGIGWPRTKWKSINEKDLQRMGLVQWLKCNGTQGNAVPPPAISGSKRSPASETHSPPPVSGSKRSPTSDCYNVRERRTTIVKPDCSVPPRQLFAL